MVRSKQLDLVAALRERATSSSLFHVSVIITKGKQEAVEFTQRSRSFLFAASFEQWCKWVRDPPPSNLNPTSGMEYCCPHSCFLRLQ
jgi:hypothetical protein